MHEHVGVQVCRMSLDERTCVVWTLCLMHVDPVASPHVCVVNPFHVQALRVECCVCDVGLYFMCVSLGYMHMFSAPWELVVRVQALCTVCVGGWDYRGRGDVVPSTGVS